MFTAVLTVFTPYVTKWLTTGIKKLQSIQLSGNRVLVVRFVAGVLSFAGVVGLAWSSGGQVEAMQIQTFADGLITFLATQGVYFLGKK